MTEQTAAKGKQAEAPDAAQLEKRLAKLEGELAELYAPKEPTRAEQVAALEYGDCPRCTAGILRVTGYDPEASHEALQGVQAEPFEPSGGAVHRHCFLCDYHESTPIEAPEGEAA